MEAEGRRGRGARPSRAGLLVMTVVLGAAAGACAPKYEKPWTKPKERTKYMVTVAAKMIAPVPNSCITEILHKLEGKQAGALRGHPTESFAGSLCQAPDSSDRAPASEESRRPNCERVLRSCGNCHLPKVNNCNYAVTWQHKGETLRTVNRPVRVGSNSITLQVNGVEKIGFRDGTSVVGRVVASSKLHLAVLVRGNLGLFPRSSISYQDFLRDPKTDEPQSQRFDVAIADIKKIEWRDGADPLEDWWDFRRFSPRGHKARRMFDIVAKHKVGCTNCHVGHGDFQLTKEGMHFQKTGKVIRRVTLERFLSEDGDRGRQDEPKP